MNIFQFINLSRAIVLLNSKRKYAYPFLYFSVIPSHYITPPYLTANPEVSHHILTPRWGKKYIYFILYCYIVLCTFFLLTNYISLIHCVHFSRDKFLIIASDGLWEKLGTQKVILQLWKKLNETNERPTCFCEVVWHKHHYHSTWTSDGKYDNI